MYSIYKTNRNASYSIPIRVHSAQLKDNEGKLSGEMRTDKQGATDTELTNRALVGHNFKNFTVNKPFDCHLLCFVEKCRCQGYQMKGEHSCELLDEERFAAPDDFVEEQGYECYDMSREYEKTVRYSDVINLKIIPVTERGSHV